MRYVSLYNHQLPQSALNSQTPIQALKHWYASHPHLFLRRPYDRPGCDNYAQTLGNYIDRQVRGQLRRLANAEGINDSRTSNLLAVNRNIRSDFIEGRGIPDNRLGFNLFADTTLAAKSGYTEQIMKWNAIRLNANYLIIRPTNMPSGSSYVIPHTAIQPYVPQSVGRRL